MIINWVGAGIFDMHLKLVALVGETQQATFSFLALEK